MNKKFIEIIDVFYFHIYNSLSININDTTKYCILNTLFHLIVFELAKLKCSRSEFHSDNVIGNHRNVTIIPLKY